MIDKKAKYGKVDRAIGSFFSKLLHNVPKRRGNTEVSDLITKNKNRFGPAEAGLMSGFGVNKLVSGPVNRTRVIDDLEFISKHDDVLRRVPERHLDDLVKQQTKGSIDDVTREVILEGSDVHHSNLYNRGDK
ncbi:hypothetical protein H8D85_01540 [bacterium]|nr:hypothetical protein [bacterium]